MPSLPVLALCAAVLIPSLFSSQGPSNVSQSDFHYAVTLAVDPQEQTVSGRARLSGLDSHAGSPIQFRFSRTYAFKTLEPRLMDNLGISSGGEALDVERVDPFIWRLAPGVAEGAAIDVEWTIKIDHREHPEVIAATDAYEQPYLTEAFGMLFTAAVFPVPEIDEEGSPEPSVSITFDLPDEWDVVTPWPASESDGWSFTPSLEEFRNDMVLAGNWRLRKVQAGALAATFAFAPGEEWLEPLVEKKLGGIVEAEIELFGGAPQPKYLFVFGPSEGVQGYGGSPKSSSMILFVSQALPKASLERDITHLVAHEFHHAWMRARCRPHGELRFVMEGFTDYFAYLVSWRLGDLSDEAFKSALEEKIGIGTRAIESYGRSLAEAGGPDFFRGRAAYDACYRSGLTLALWTDLALRQAEDPRTLDGFLRAFYNDEAWEDGTRPTLDHWEAQLRDWIGESLAERQVSVVQSAEGYDLLELFEDIGTSIKATSRIAGKTPMANFNGSTLRVLDPTGPAALAGLRARDRLISVNGEKVTGESDVRRAWSNPVGGNLVLEFERDGEQRAIEVPVPTLLDYELPPSVLTTLAGSPADDD